MVGENQCGCFGEWTSELPDRTLITSRLWRHVSSLKETGIKAIAMISVK